MKWSQDIYSDTSIAPYLGFKGGTAALLFYDLSRGSVDLDFDLLDESKEQSVFEKIHKIASGYGKIVDSRIKRFSLVNIILVRFKGPVGKRKINL